MEVVGVLGLRGHSATGQDQDDTVLIPFRTSQERVLGVASPSTAQSQSTVFLPPPNPFGIQPRLTGFVHTMFVQARSTALVKTWRSARAGSTSFSNSSLRRRF